MESRPCGVAFELGHAREVRLQRNLSDALLYYRPISLYIVNTRLGGIAYNFITFSIRSSEVLCRVYSRIELEFTRRFDERLDGTRRGGGNDSPNSKRRRKASDKVHIE